MKRTAIFCLIVLTASVALAKDHSYAYQVGVFRSSGTISDGTYSTASCGTFGCSGSAYNAAHNVHYVQTAEGTYAIESPVSVGRTMLLGMATPGGNSPTVHKAWFMDQLSDGAQVMFAVGCNKHNRCTFWLPNPDKIGKEIETQGWFQPFAAPSNATSLCGTGRLTPEMERQVCQQEQTAAGVCPCGDSQDQATCRANWAAQCGGEQQQQAPPPQPQAQPQAPPPPAQAPAPAPEPRTPPAQQMTYASIVGASNLNGAAGQSAQPRAVPQPGSSSGWWVQTPQPALTAQQALRETILKNSNAGFQKAHAPGYVEISGDDIIVHSSTTTAEKVSTYLTSTQFEQQLLPTLRQAGLATLTYTNDSDLTFLYDVNAGQLVGETASN